MRYDEIFDPTKFYEPTNLGPGWTKEYENQHYATMFQLINGNVIMSKAGLWPGVQIVALNEAGNVYVLENVVRETETGTLTAIEIINGGIKPGLTPLEAMEDILLRKAGVKPANIADVALLCAETGEHYIDGMSMSPQFFFLVPVTIQVQQPPSNLRTRTFKKLFAMERSYSFHDGMNGHIVRRAADWAETYRPDLLK